MKSGYRTTIPVRKPVSTYGASYQAPTTKSNLVQIGGIRKPSVIPPQSALRKPEKLQPEETLFQRFAKDTVWGMGQGFFETAAEFFRSHRLK